MERLEFPQTHCLAAIGQSDITPPIGIFHRMWGAARHDRATGVHRPLLATLAWLEPLHGDTNAALVVVALDHCILDNSDIERIQTAIAEAVSLRSSQVLVTLSHTHAAGLMSRSRANDPGGELIGPYLDEMITKLAALAEDCLTRRQPATLQYGYGRCDLAAQRDYWDPELNHHVCGFHPEGPADDTLLVMRLVSEAGDYLGTIINYACHPTTLAWDNTQISPDYPGALREMVTQQTGAPCLFLLGACGDLGPRDGYVGDPEVADRNGRQVAFSALASLESMPSPRCSYVYQGPVVSGTLIGTWGYEPTTEEVEDQQTHWHTVHQYIDLPYRVELPGREETEQQLKDWQAKEILARKDGDESLAADCRAQAEQATRTLWRLNALPAGRTYPLPVTMALLGQSAWIFVAGEHYQDLQQELRQRFAHLPLVIVTVTNGWQPGYIPPARTYGYEIYQEQIAVVSAGSAEVLIEQITRQLADWTDPRTGGHHCC